MKTGDAEYFGSGSQQRLQQRAADIWHLLRDDPRFCTHGRAVGLSDYAPDNLSTQLALARLQGVCSMEGLSRETLDLRKSELAAEGLVTDEFACWMGGPAALDSARSVLRDRSLPEDLTAVAVGPETPEQDIRNLDALTQACDVLLPMGSFLRGRERPSAFVYARDREGRVVGASGAVAQFHPDHPKGGRFWWGMLATDTRRRGEGIAILMGAMSLLRMNESFGLPECFTGIRAGNAASEALCSRLGLSASDSFVLIAIFPGMFSEGRITK